MAVVKGITNLEALIIERNINFSTLGKAIGVTEKTARNKVHRVTHFTLPEAKTVKDVFFPDKSLEYIFKGYGM